MSKIFSTERAVVPVPRNVSSSILRREAAAGVSVALLHFADAQHEDQQAGDEDPASLGQVAGPAAEQQQPAERHRVGVDHPLQVRPEKPSAVWICGRATVTMFKSSTTMS
jgi:hypothetical protein